MTFNTTFQSHHPMNYPIAHQARDSIKTFFSRLENRLVHILQPSLAIAATGLIAGTYLPRVVDDYFRKKQKGSDFTPLQDRIQALSFANKLLWASAGLGALASWGVTGRLYTSVNIVLSSLAVGFTLATKTLLSRTPFSYSKV